ncbi:hypothetical protein L208DRAFT_1390337 [Tricholoma matsutake]|nr:hypothetical protein L208DRAFT_1390337 [Tricholoma matsutake 945]
MIEAITTPQCTCDALSTYARGPDTLEPESLVWYMERWPWALCWTCHAYLASYLAKSFQGISPPVLVNF